MHRKPQLQDAARHLQQAFNNHNGSLSYAQALDVLGQLEGFEGYRQLKSFVSAHAQTNSAPGANAPTGATQSLAMLLYGHYGFDGQRARIGNQRRIEGIRPVGMTRGIPPSSHRMWVEDLEALMVAADHDAGEQYGVGMHDQTVLMSYIGTTGSHTLTWKQIREAEHVEGAIWNIDGVPYEFLEYVPAPAPDCFVPYKAKPGEFMSKEEYDELSKELDYLQMDLAKGQEQDHTDARMAEIDALLDASPWTRDMDTSQVVSKAALATNRGPWSETIPF